MGLLDAFGLDKKIDSVKNSIAAVNGAAGGESGQGVTRTDGVSPIGLVGKNGTRYIPGFTPNELYNFGVVQNTSADSNITWFGSLLQNHPDYTSDVNTKFNPISTSERFDLSKTFPKSESEVYSSRDYYLIFNDSSSDYFRHGLHIEGRTPIKSDKNDKESFDGLEEGGSLRVSNLESIQKSKIGYENNDPIMFGFELVIDAVSSPLLNGSVEDFIEQFSRISEVASKKNTMIDFKQQFIKFFKTKGTVKLDNPTQLTMSIPVQNYANSESQTSLFGPGKKAYMSYYLKKIQGLDLLIESNTGDKKKYITDYRKDLIKLNFLEDVSLNLGTLSHLYKLLYWSKANGKNIIPENLLRFNCDIIISEVRHYNRVRKAIDNGDLEVLKDNLSRHVYSLKECQLWFDQPGHDSEVDLSSIKIYEDFVVSMDFKYVTKKFERWTPDDQGFGQYVGYNNGAIWKIGNPGARNVDTGTVKDTSIPKFFTINSNTLKHNGVGSPIVLDGYSTSVENESMQNPLDQIVSVTQGDESDEDSQNLDKKAKRKAKRKAAFDEFKDTSKIAAKKLVKNLEKAAFTELQQQINTRLRLLNNTLDKIRNSIGIGRMREPTNVYRPYYVNGISNQFFYDVHNSLRDFLGESLGSVVGNNAGGMIKGNDHTGLFGGG